MPLVHVLVIPHSLQRTVSNISCQFLLARALEIKAVVQKVEGFELEYQMLFSSRSPGILL